MPNNTHRRSSPLSGVEMAPSAVFWDSFLAHSQLPTEKALSARNLSEALTTDADKPREYASLSLVQASGAVGLPTD